LAAPRHTLRWVGAVIALFVSVWALYRLFDRLTEPGANLELNQFVLPALSLALVILALALAGVLIRHLVRLIVDRKRGILGARLRTKLVFFFLALVLLPALVLFYGSAHVIKESVEAVLRTPLEDLTQRSGTIVQEWREYLQNQALDLARSVAREIAEEQDLPTGPGDAEGFERTRVVVERLLARWAHQEEPAHIRVASVDRTVAEIASPAAAVESEQRDAVDSLFDALVRQVSESGQEAANIDYLGDGLLAHAAVPVEDGRLGRGGERYVVSVGIVVPPRLAGNLEGIDRAASIYRQFRVQRRDLVRLYLTLTGLVFLTTLFVATWIGFYVARRITRPIQELADATREVAAGNLEVRVDTDIGDELGMLVEAFNDMAAELQENREVITRSTADLRRSNRALDERRRYIETLLANLSTAVVSLDPDGRVTTANPAALGILGVQLHVGDDAQRQFRDHGLFPLADLLQREQRRKGEGIRKDLTLDRSGATLSVAVQISPLRGSSDEHLGTLVMVEDLTELMRAQRVAAWREVARRIAHEIKNPLTPIQLWAQRLRKKFAEETDDLGTVVPEATAAIEHEVAALKQLVDEFSLFARLPEIKPRQVNLEQLVDSVLALYKGLPEIEWDVTVGRGLERVRLDPDQLRRVLINLIDNAIAVMNRRGRISITAAKADDDRTVRLEVADTGPGIDPAERGKMFSPYFSTKKRGTGLGLAIVHKVVTDHEGTIRVENNEPTGARFVIELPAMVTTDPLPAGGASES
jgi:two-component system nitrogen regulation sensor histidine kinase NtrY